jgi:hypothetical protein
VRLRQPAGLNLKRMFNHESRWSGVLCRLRHHWSLRLMLASDSVPRLLLTGANGTCKVPGVRTTPPGGDNTEDEDRGACTIHVLRLDPGLGY